MKSLSIEEIRLKDKSNMLNLLLEFPKQLTNAMALGGELDISVDTVFNKIVFSGLGGSAIGADLIRSYVAEECKLPIIVNRDYTLPAFVDKETLLIISSYSGNTEETLSAYNDGLDRGANIVAITSNGELKKLADKDNFPYISIPGGLPPRCALGYSSIPTTILFSKLGLIQDKSGEIEETAQLLSKLRDEILAPHVKEDKNVGKRVAKALLNRYAIIYGASKHFDVAVTRLRGQLAENSKTISSTHVFPEMNHNEIVGWLNPKKMIKDLIVLMLRDRDDHPRVKTRMDISKTIIEKEGVKIIEINSEGNGLLSRLFSLIYIGDFISFYLAILNDVDPTPVDNVTYLKKELARL